MTGTVPIYLTSFNLLTWLRAACDRLAQVPQARVVIVDNASTYEPLLDWYKTCPYPVYRCHENLGPLAAWKSGVVWDWKDGDYYAVAPADLDLADTPLDMLDRLEEAFARWPTVQKAGLSLKIDDLPDHCPIRDEVREWEGRYWRDKLDDQFYHGGNRSTLALYNRKRPCVSERQALCSVRTAPPYTARHLPWYLDTAALPEEYLQYTKTARAEHTRWTKRLWEQACYDM